jgi:hypothetical protein
VGEMRQRRESGCGRGSKGRWGTWASYVAGVLGARVRGSAAVRGKDGANRVALRRRERERERDTERERDRGARGTNGYLP